MRRLVITDVLVRDPSSIDGKNACHDNREGGPETNHSKT